MPVIRELDDDDQLEDGEVVVSSTVIDPPSSPGSLVTEGDLRDQSKCLFEAESILGSSPKDKSSMELDQDNKRGIPIVEEIPSDEELGDDDMNIMPAPQEPHEIIANQFVRHFYGIINDIRSSIKQLSPIEQPSSAKLSSAESQKRAHVEKIMQDLRNLFLEDSLLTCDGVQVAGQFDIVNCLTQTLFSMREHDVYIYLVPVQISTQPTAFEGLLIQVTGKAKQVEHIDLSASTTSMRTIDQASFTQIFLLQSINSSYFVSNCILTFNKYQVESGV